MFYFREGANFCFSSYLKFIQKTFKWNLNQNQKNLFFIGKHRNANCFTGDQGYKSMESIADELSGEIIHKNKKMRIILKK